MFWLPVGWFWKLARNIEIIFTELRLFLFAPKILIRKMLMARPKAELRKAHNITLSFTDTTTHHIPARVAREAVGRAAGPAGQDVAGPRSGLGPVGAPSGVLL